MRGCAKIGGPVQGATYLQLLKLNEAIADFSAALRIAPNIHELWNLRGLTYLLQSDCRRAIADFDEAIRRKPGYTVAIRNRRMAEKIMRERNAG